MKLEEEEKEDLGDLIVLGQPQEANSSFKSDQKR